MFAYLLLVLFSLGQIGRVSLLNQTVNFYLYEIVLSILLIILFIRYRLKPIIYFWGKSKSTLLFLGILILSLLVSFSSFSPLDNLIAVLYLFRILFYFFVFFYSYFHILKNNKVNLKKPLILSIWITAGFSLIQYFFYPNLRNLYYLGWDSHLYRVFGSFFDVFVAASVYGLVLLYLVFNFRNLNWNKSLKYLALAVYILFGLLTYSRGFYMSILLTLAVYLISKRKYLYILLMLIIFASGIFLIPKPFGEGVNLKRTFTIEARYSDDKKALETFKQNPILGVGYNHLRAIKNTTSAFPNHGTSSFSSSYLTILAASGILGLLFFLLTIHDFSKFEGTKFYTLFLGIFSLFDNVFLHPFVLFLYFYLAVLNLSRKSP